MASGFSNGYSRTYDAHSSDSDHSDNESKQKRSVLKHRNTNKRNNQANGTNGNTKTMKPCLVHKNSLTSDEDSLLPSNMNFSSFVDTDLNNSNNSSVTFTTAGASSAFAVTSSSSVRQGKALVLIIS
jgi:hypothetical protein